MMSKVGDRKRPGQEGRVRWVEEGRLLLLDRLALTLVPAAYALTVLLFVASYAAV